MNYELRQFYTTFSREEVWRHLDGGFGSGSRMVFYHSFWFLGTIGASNGIWLGIGYNSWLICFVHIWDWIGILSGPLLLGMIFRV